MSADETVLYTEHYKFYSSRIVSSEPEQHRKIQRKKKPLFIRQYLSDSGNQLYNWSTDFIRRRTRIEFQQEHEHAILSWLQTPLLRNNIILLDIGQF